MAKPIYTARARVRGGRINGHGETSDGALAVDLRIPAELGGQEGGTNPEQLFAIGYAACFENALIVVARREKLDADDVDVDSRVMLIPGENRAYKLAVELDVKLPSIEDQERAAELVRAADRVCPYSNATRGNIDLKLTANGAPLTEEA